MEGGDRIAPRGTRSDESSSPTTGSDTRRAAERARLDSNSSVRARSSSSGSLASIPRSGSSVSTISYSEALPAALQQLKEEHETVDSDSTGGNDYILTSPPASFEETTVAHTQGDSTGQDYASIVSAHEERHAHCSSADSVLTRTGDAFEKSTEDCQAEGDGAFSQQVPLFKSPLQCKDQKDFILSKICCHLQEMLIEEVQMVLESGGSRVINSQLFVVKKFEYNMFIQVRISKPFVSIGIVLVKGKNDKTLVWPFGMIVMIRLKNLSGGDSLTRMFRCDKNGSKIKEAIARPAKNTPNPGIGFPCFISRRRLLDEGFIRNNKMLVECYLFPKDQKVDQPAEVPSIIK